MRWSEREGCLDFSIVLVRRRAEYVAASSDGIIMYRSNDGAHRLTLQVAIRPGWTRMKADPIIVRAARRLIARFCEHGLQGLIWKVLQGGSYPWTPTTPWQIRVHYTRCIEACCMRLFVSTLFPTGHQLRCDPLHDSRQRRSLTACAIMLSCTFRIVEQPR